MGNVLSCVRAEEGERNHLRPLSRVTPCRCAPGFAQELTTEKLLLAGAGILTQLTNNKILEASFLDPNIDTSKQLFGGINLGK